MYLFFDTETTGWARSKPLAHPEQPYMCQLAAILTDENNVAMAQFASLIKIPIEMPEGALKVHGKTNEMLERYGQSLGDVLVQFATLGSYADTWVAHNMVFDDKILAIAKARAGILTGSPTHKRCTMVRARELGSKGGLAEAYRYFCNKVMLGAHDAMQDAEACRELFFAMNEPAAPEAVPLREALTQAIKPPDPVIASMAEQTGAAPEFIQAAMNDAAQLVEEATADPTSDHIDPAFADKVIAANPEPEPEYGDFEPFDMGDD